MGMFERRSTRVGLTILAVVGAVALGLALTGYYTWGALIR